ncbi:hypothetical protein ACE1MK_07720 [Tenacibaculum maritimum]|uniref:hypothetical protein n=1 Tax=Tenacibaculum maritimum TaxID=107401 RepID=UPI0012E4186E|nr:hypothetical protein [Tenacibaculum maritimum]CAA0205566.1 conserved hypothetical protein [Tenacibaculum maritimum]
MNKTVFIPYLVIFNIVIISPKQYFPLFFYVSKLQIHQIIQRYNYHPFSPTVLLNSKNPTFLLKDKDQKEGIRFTKLPAFLLYANNQKAFWKNVLTGVEYSVDILTTVSGVGNLIKAGRLVKLLKNGKTLLYKTKQVTTAIATTKTIAGVIEVSSGTVNALLKLTSIDDTKLGISISKYLFYLEMIALTGEVSVFLKGKLQQSAKEIVENPKFTKSLDELVKKGNISELEEFNFYREILKASRQYSDDLKILGIVPKLTNATEKAFLKKLKVIFYKKYKVYLLKLNEEIVIAEKWKQTTNSKPLIKSEIDELLSLRKLKKSAFNKNTAIMEVDLLIKNEELTLKYKAIAGKGQSAEDLVKSANQEDLIRQLELSDKNDLMSHFKAIDKQTGELKNRFQDSEVKMLDTFDEHLSKFHVKYGEENIKIINMRLKTLYEPCMSCKKQFIIRQEIYGINKIDIKATWNIKEEKFVQGNKGLQELSLIK